MSDKRDILTPVGRVVYPKLFTAEGFDADTPPDKFKYSVTLLFDKEEADLTELRDAYAKCMKENHKSIKLGTEKNPAFKDGDEHSNEAFHGCWYVDFSSNVKVKPPIVGPAGKGDKIEESSGRIFAGVYGRVATSPYSYDHKGNKGVKFGLNAFQLKEPGEEIITGGDSSASFDAFEEIELSDEDMADLVG